MEVTHDTKITTDHDTGLMRPSGGGAKINIEKEGSDDASKDLAQHDKNVSSKTEKECHKLRKNIMTNVENNKKAQERLSFTSSFSKTLHPVDDKKPTAPVLENFDDYAPVDIQTYVPLDRGHIKVKPDHSMPKAVNELEPVHQSKFDCEYRVPWSGKKGNDDLSNFFDTRKANQFFDQNQRIPIACPTEWEVEKKH